MKKEEMGCLIGLDSAQGLSPKKEKEIPTAVSVRQDNHNKLL